MRFVARQPIVNKDGSVFAHELFFSPSSGLPNPREIRAAGASPIQLSDVTEGHLAFVNTTEAALLGGAIGRLSPTDTVVEVLETVPPSAEVLAACRALRESGYRIALDDFVYRPELQPLVDQADFIKVEWPDLGAVRSKVRGVRPLRFVVERIETEVQLREAVEAGYELFQGYQLGRPEVVSGIDRARVEDLCRLFGQGT